MIQSLSPSFESFYDRIKEILETARNRVYRAANSEMVCLIGILDVPLLKKSRKALFERIMESC